MSAFDGIRVLCVGQFYFAPYASLMLARLGADVIKIEAPNGDPYRRLPTADEDGDSIQFSMLNSGKRTMKLNLQSTEGQDVLRKLVAESDVLVQNLAPGAMERFGLGWENLKEVNPRLVMASGSGFGSFGPYAGQPAMDLTIQARTAVMSTTGFMDGPPVRTGPSVVDFMAGAHIFGGIVAALFQRERTGRGQHVEVALQDAILPSLVSNFAGLIHSNGTMPERTGNRHGGLAVTPYNAYRTTDGWVTILCPTETLWQRLCDIMGDPDARAERLATMDGRHAHSEEVDTIISRWACGFTKAEVATRLEGSGIPTAPVIGLQELLEDEHVHARGVLRRMEDDRGEWLTLGSPLFLSDSPIVEPTRAHRLGEDTDAILMNDLGLTADDVASLRAAGAI
jgi:crotonobetainyl-CoA:carnitine CoA-transferase CaiB-like acyl-CoA transferase